MEKKGISHTLDVLDLIEKLTVDIIKATSDGLQLSDVSVIKNNFEAITKVVLERKELLPEIKDLDDEEKRTLSKRAVDLGFNIHKAIEEIK